MGVHGPQRAPVLREGPAGASTSACDGPIHPTGPRMKEGSTPPINLEAARVLREAARFLAHASGRILWSRRMKRTHSRLHRDYRIELGRDLRLRVFDARTSLMVCEASVCDALRLLRGGGADPLSSSE